MLVARRLETVRPVLEAVEAAVANGAWAAGYLAYEAAQALDPGLATHAPDDSMPLAWWGVFSPPDEVAPPAPPADALRLAWRPRLDEAEYRRALAAIHDAIAAGDTYQANFTFRFEAPLVARDCAHRTTDAEALFAALCHAQHSRYAAFLELGSQAVASASPELFLRRDGRRLLARPMKGTARRGRWPADDAARRDELRSAKNRAENLMIVDMTRNDLGRVAAVGSVRVRSLFGVETYPTVHQQVSTIEAQSDAGFVELLTALFPCASITGAPKASTMKILRRLEATPRGVYTGAIGYLAPDRRIQLSVAIRTVVVDRGRGVARYGTGGGIVWDSDAGAEWAEAHTKALVLTAGRPAIELLETLRWRPRSGFFLRAGHLDRLVASATYFDLPGASRLRAAAEATLDRLDARLRSDGADRQRVRLRYVPSADPADGLRVDAEPFPCVGRRPWTLAVDSAHPVDPDDVFLFHKTTRRAVYEDAAARHPDADDVLLVNRRGELTESTRANLVVRRHDRLLTPPLESGLLPGVYRQALLARGRLHEAVLRPADLATADAIFLVNSLRGWTRCRLPVQTA